MAIVQTKRAATVGFFALLFIIDCYLYFRNPGHFFQADTVYLLDNRVGSIAEFLREFFGVLARGPRGVRSRAKLGLWYDGKRERHPA